ncbi:GPI mannosyltransferase 1 [Yamadazyma tenuis]|uniref:GPI mannosyltransferase 1 n=2 Tax=Candida tenuis (strain ATCC 10573 / BCRC 21748 / CBS 615 / JCM 9827 / NBRC 10315 / NRRL Y-1498 / VKM Y-70) TaxID=590646 RepID=G3B6B9_CANTC|nr:uncharacterized protein CANTEDRAFT_114738 [Yamadazyma tenuis ATCC 10573]EGV63671.1 hypothetical protein CANTEDRAFT_114738 [Yamadazyma tenuis ATCC 10573]WEJ96745.1 GPI mannosyltransferase 1 [Yamadazyma tenuis]
MIVKSVVLASIVLRLVFFAYGLYQDENMNVRYTDIDYLVFSDAANYVYNGLSPYNRETYRYTPLLAWILVPNSYGGWFYHFGKAVFMVCDVITGILILKLLRLKTSSSNKSAVLSAIWLLNPMVITISTRGSSESILTVMIMASIYYLYRKSVVSSAIWLGFAIHFKIYPVIYLPSIMLYLVRFGKPFIDLPVLRWVNTVNIKFAVVTVLTVSVLNGVMYHFYGYDFLYNSYLYHFSRLDHRHNFSLYNVLLYYKSSMDGTETGLLRNIEKFSFVPQLALAGIILPLKFARRDLVSNLFLQTFAFVTFNKVITSQYFIWFLIFLPQYLASSALVRARYVRGIVVLVLWVATQALWLYFAYKLEFLGESTFDNGLLLASCVFFISNCWILRVFIDDTDTTC